MVLGIMVIAYVAASVYPVYRFVFNPLTLAKMRSVTAAQMDLGAESGVTEKQQDLINLSSKYLFLFIVAVSTTIIGNMMNALFRVFLELEYRPGFMSSIDNTVN